VQTDGAWPAGVVIANLAATAVASAVNPRICLSTPFWNRWARIAIEHEARARRARRRASALAAEQDQASGSLIALLDAEMCAGMVVIATTAHALDALYAVVQQRVPGPQPSVDTEDDAPSFRSKKRSKRASHVLEALKRGFAVGKASHRWVGEFKWLFTLRNDSVHFSEETSSPVRHPTGLEVAPEFVAYSLEAAERAVDLLLDVLVECVRQPKSPLASWSEALRAEVEALVALRETALSQLEADA
jgi:hypothetical protein